MKDLLISTETTEVAATEVYEVRKYSAEEYFAIAENYRGKVEYLNGNLIFMSKAKRNHNIIITNCSTKLDIFGKETQSIMVYSNSQAVYIMPKNSYYLPDVVVADKQKEQFDEHDNLLNPIIVIEVVSPSTANYDRNEKFLGYRSLPSLQEYILIEQDTVFIEQFFRNANNRWELIEYTNLSQDLIFQSINLGLKLTTIYADAVV
jgi:Uma2 family endonuclease